MKEYERAENMNTPEYWDKRHKMNPDLGSEKKAQVRARVLEWLDDLPRARVVEFGFGSLHLARAIGTRWSGRDFSPEIVKAAKSEGLDATVRRCGESEGFRKSYLVALEVLEHLDASEMTAFLEKSRNAPHAFFSVPVSTRGDENFKQHQRGWESVEDFRAFLLTYWPYVAAEKVGKWFLAHAQTKPPVIPPVLTVGSSTLLDFSGTHWTLASWQTHHGSRNGEVEFVIVDNHPEPTVRCLGVKGYFCDECKRIGKDGPTCTTCANNLAAMQGMVEGEGARYIRWSDKQGTYPGKNQLKVEALGKWVLTMDSHVLLTPGAIDACFDQIEEDTDDFFHFPNLLRSHNPSHPGRPAATDFRKQQWIYHAGKGRGGGAYGWTGEAKKAGEPYPVAAMITSCYLVKRDAWFSAKGYDPILGNYGGWEGPLQLKWWLMGRKVRSLRYRRQADIDRHGFLHHYHEFSNKQTRQISDNQTMNVHSQSAKNRNFAASSAVIGGEWWVRRHCALKGWNYNSEPIQTGMRAGMKFRPWMVENLARPEWEDIRVFFKWMRDEAKVPGALEGW